MHFYRNAHVDEFRGSTSIVDEVELPYCSGLINDSSGVNY